MIAITEDRRMLGYGSLGAYPDIIHFVTTRRGGCSEGAYASFNCSPFSGDREEHVRSNQDSLCESLLQRPLELVIPHQVHGVRCLVVDETYLQAAPAQKQEWLEGTDALLTAEPGYCLCISTADCVPVLLYDKRLQAIAAVHAGWRGTVEGIVERTMQCMRTVFGTKGEDVIACIGPGISLQAFEVGGEVYEAFLRKGYDMAQIACWNEETEKHHLDLWEANRRQLLDFGVPAAQIETAGICTYTNQEQFFSARRLGIHSGRILSGIMIIRK